MSTIIPETPSEQHSDVPGEKNPQSRAPVIGNEHKDLIKEIKKEKEDFIKDMKKQEQQIKRQELERLVNGTQAPERVEPPGISGGEPADELAKTRRNVVKKVRVLFSDAFESFNY